MPGNSCRHTDLSKFNGMRTYLVCGETVFETIFQSLPISAQRTATPTRYQYTNLNYAHGRQEIRLTGTTEEPLTCEITHVILQENPVYDAVSYTWATEEGDDSLSRRTGISKNLEYLLSRRYRALESLYVCSLPSIGYPPGTLPTRDPAGTEVNPFRRHL
jgi:hypothetical protein